MIFVFLSKSNFTPLITGLLTFTFWNSILTKWTNRRL